MQSNYLLKNEEFLKTKVTARKFKGAAPNDHRHFINKRLQKPRSLNLKCMSAVNNDNETNGNRYNSVLPISSKIFYCQLK
jgi:hypothetical protein